MPGRRAGSPHDDRWFTRKVTSCSFTGTLNDTILQAVAVAHALVEGDRFERLLFSRHFSLNLHTHVRLASERDAHALRSDGNPGSFADFRALRRLIILDDTPDRQGPQSSRISRDGTRATRVSIAPHAQGTDTAMVRISEMPLLTSNDPCRPPCGERARSELGSADSSAGEQKGRESLKTEIAARLAEVPRRTVKPIEH